MRNEDAITAACHRLDWRVQVTNTPIEKLSLAQAVCHYRGGWCLERDFHLVKDLPLTLNPLFVWKQEHIVGLTRLLTLALGLLTLVEMRVRQEWRMLMQRWLDCMRDSLMTMPTLRRMALK